MKRVPPRMTFVGIEGRDFGQGEGLTAAVEQSLAIAIEVVKAELQSCAGAAEHRAS
jgi:hypothetical protein